MSRNEARPTDSDVNRVEPQQARRRRVLWIALAVLGVLALGLCVWGALVEPARLIERDYRLPLAHWSPQCDGVRVDVVSDLHVGSPHNGLAQLDVLVQRLQASDSDLVLMAGDYVILSVFLGTYVPSDQIAAHLRPLARSKPVYAVLGNHDWWKNGPQISQRFADAGIHMIDNRALPVQVRDCRFWLVGLGDMLEGHPKIPETFAQVPEDSPVLALTHEPRLWPKIRGSVALTVAGHTHGGQINLLPRAAPGTFSADSAFQAGWIRQDGRDLFVSPGIGTSIVPVRFGVPPEISRLTLIQRIAQTTAAKGG